ncbi:tRNA (adenosine(37)-N6)-threonylcarbamoyltransferase complex transferase subunit TsaD [Candidatus Saccharibacteria bacterium]|nr:tRNA (adenosine(37)-N6)-threonylcarbamoyltransferase complex transferase subunit TsaD [Candidatus Saccharibacteria bacterium]
MKVLGIESTCDETAAAVVSDGRVLSNIVASQIDIHKEFGGVFPEIAAREHLRVILPTIKLALKEAGCIKESLAELRDNKTIDAIAVANRPGLIGGLMIGAMTARTLAEVLGLPLVAVDHVYAHIYGVEPAEMRFPLLALVVSGGHSTIYLLESPTNYQILGETRDDAVGEAFDKAAKILGLPYPGGPSISQAADAYKATGKEQLLPAPKLDNPYEFSFSGLKTAFLRRAQEMAGGNFRMSSDEVADKLADEQKNELAFVFQESAVRILLNALEKAAKVYRPEQIIISGGVAANSRLRDKAHEVFGACGADSGASKLLLPERALSTDNAVMIARAALAMGLPKTAPRDLKVTPN